MRTPPRLLGATLVLALAMAAAGCGKTGPAQPAGGGPVSKVAPVAGGGAVSVVTRNTTRLGGADPATDAAAVARLAYPGLTAATRPKAVVLVDQRNWSAALAASVLASAPLGAPLLYSEGDTLPAVSRQALEAMRPAGAQALGGAQVIRVGTSAAVPNGYLARSLAAGEPAAAAAGVEQLLRAADGGNAPREAIVLASGAAPALQMPAAGLAAESGAPILFVTAASVPAATASVLSSLGRPSIYVIGSAALGSRTLKDLARFGPVTSIPSASTAVERDGAVPNAISVARFTDGVFGWGVKEPGHGLVFANIARPLDAPASALLSATGDYGPLLLLEAPTQVPPPLAGYLGDIQPAYTSAPEFRPVRGVYNHGWLIGDERAISAVTQAEIDSMLEITPRKASSEEPSVSPAE
jgi:hypothetical protein